MGETPVGETPYTVLSCCISLDGFLDDRTVTRLVLSSPGDLERVDSLRAGSDAILVGAGTVRADNPRLAVRDATRRAERRAAGRTATPLRVTVTRSGELDPRSAFFATDDDEKLVYCPDATRVAIRGHHSAATTVVGCGADVDLAWVLADLGTRGVQRLVVEGGQSVLTQLLTAGLANELQLAVAPVFVGDSGAPRFVGDGAFPWMSPHRARLREVRQCGDTALLHYQLTPRCRTVPVEKTVS